MKRFYSRFGKIIAVSLISLFASAQLNAAGYNFSVTRNSAVALQGNCDYQRGAALSGNCNYVVTVNQVAAVSGTYSTYKIFKVSDGTMTTANSLGGTWGGSDFAIANDENGIIVHPKHYNATYYAPWRWLYKGNFDSGTVSSVGNEWTLTNSGTYTTTSTDIRSQAFRINGDITGSSSVWSCPAAKNYVLEFVGVNGGFSKVTTYSVSGLPSGYTHGTCATGYKYDTNKFLICSPNGVYNCNISGTTMTATNVTPSGVNNINLVGSAIFKLRDHYFFVRSKSSTFGASEFGIFDVTNGFPGTQLYADTPKTGTGGGSSATSVWINFHKQNDNQMTIVVFVRYLCVAKYTLNATPICDTPTFSPTSWSNEANQRTVTITSGTGGTIHYTTDGSNPTTSSPSISSGGTVTLDGNVTTLKAIAVRSGYANSSVGTAGAYNFKCATPTANVNGGTYTTHQHITLSTATTGATIRYTTDGSAPTSSSTAYSGTINVTSTTRIRAKAFKNNYSDSNEFDQTYTINATLAAPTFSVATGTQFTTSGTVTITAPAGSTLKYNTDGGSEYATAAGNTMTVNITVATTLKAYATQTDKTDSSVATASYSVKCATPVITPGTGTYSKEQAVNISCSTPGATIHYTTDGSTPTASSPIFSPPLTVNEGSNTNEYIPVYVWYTDAYEKHEYIIPASTMSSMGASASSAVSINSLTWYLSSPASSGMGYAKFKVFLKEVTGTTFNTFEEPEGGTVVYEGTLSAIQNTLTVNFSTPFEYHGGNLLVGVFTTVNGYWEQVFFYGTTGAEGCSGYKWSRDGLDAITTPETTAGTTNFLPKTTFYYTTDPLIISQTTTIKAIAIKNGCVNSDVASETITIQPQSNPVTNINVAYSPVIGVSANNPTGDLARIDGTVTFSRPTTSDGGTFPAYPSTFSGYYLDHYVVTVFTGSSTYAKTDSGDNFLSVSIDAKSGAGAANTVSLNARDLKLNENTEVYVTAHYVYQPTSTASQSSQTTASVGGYTYNTYPPSIEARIYVTPHQMHKVWWGSEHEEHTVYADVYRVRVAITDASSTSTIPVSYYQLQVRRGSNGAWENISDRTIDNLYYGSPAATVYPAGFNLAAGRFPGNYKFNDHQTTVPPIGSGETDWDINLEYFYAFDVTNAYNPQTVTDPSQEDPMNWQFRISAVYGAGEGVTVDGVPVTVTTANVQSSDYSDYIQPSNTPIITEVDPISADDAVKEVRYFDLKGVQLNEAPQNGFYIEVRLYNSGRIETTKRLAR